MPNSYYVFVYATVIRRAPGDLSDENGNEDDWKNREFVIEGWAFGINDMTEEHLPDGMTWEKADKISKRWSANGWNVQILDEENQRVRNLLEKQSPAPI